MERVVWPASRFLFRYIGRLERRKADESPGSLVGGADRSPEAQVLDACPTVPYTLDRQVQIAAMACLSLACKFAEVTSPDLKELCTLVDSPAPPVAELLGVEMSVVVALEWNLNSPTPHQLVECFLAGLGFAVPPDSVAFEAYERIWQLAYWACDASSYLRNMAFEPVRMVAAAALGYAWRYNHPARRAFTPEELARRFRVELVPMGDRTDELDELYREFHPEQVRAAFAQGAAHAGAKRASFLDAPPIGAPTVGKSRKARHEGVTI